MTIEVCKKSAAEKAATFVEQGMSVGLGSGSTAAYFIQALAERSQKGLQVDVVASSAASHSLAERLGLRLLDLRTITCLDLYVDGADEIDPSKQMIKGAGGALLREKILASMSEKMVVVIDETKLVSKLGLKPLPVEIVPFGVHAILHHLEQLGYQGKLRLQPDGSFWLTDNHNCLYDIQLPSLGSLPQHHDQIRSVPGVVDTGFFPYQAGQVVIGFKDGSVVIRG